MSEFLARWVHAARRKLMRGSDDNPATLHFSTDLRTEWDFGRGFDGGPPITYFSGRRGPAAQGVTLATPPPERFAIMAENITADGRICAAIDKIAQAASADTPVDVLIVSLNVASKRIADLEAAHEQLGRDFNKLEARCADLESTHNDMVNLLASKDTRIAELEAALRRRTPPIFAAKSEAELLLRAVRAEGDGILR